MAAKKFRQKSILRLNTIIDPHILTVLTKTHKGGKKYDTPSFLRKS